MVKPIQPTSQPPNHPDPLPDLPNYDPEPADGVRVGESPVPGLTLRRILRGHKGSIYRFAWSPDGRFLASPSNDETIRIWDVARGECTAVLEHKDAVRSVAWSPDSSKLVTANPRNTIYIWDLGVVDIIQKREFVAGTDHPMCQTIAGGGESSLLAWSCDGTTIVYGSEDNSVQLWDYNTAEIRGELHHPDIIWSIAFSPDGETLATTTVNEDSVIRLWDVKTGKRIRQFRRDARHIYTVAWSADGQELASGASDHRIRIWDVQTGEVLILLEGHTDDVTGVSFSSDGRLLGAKSDDGTMRLWRMDTFYEVARIRFNVIEGIFGGGNMVFHPHLSYLATSGTSDTIIRIWDIDMNVLLGQPATDSVRYTTAKLVLVGDSGVGKTGLGWRLAHGEFKEHASTHGQQFWVIDELGKTRADGTKCEAVLWDLAGQHVYRPIHAIFLDDVDASLVLFDPTNRQEPLKGAEFWLEQLKGKTQLPPSVLVGARVDRGAPVLSQQELEQFCQRYGISGGYVSTSAISGEGLAQMLEILKAQIPWEQMTTTVTTVTFKRIKEYVLALKEKTDRQGVLVRPADLRRQLQATDKKWQFSDAEMMTAVGHLETHGYVTILRSSSGEAYILLAPDLLVDLASSIVLLADKNPRELGAVNETELLQGKYPFDDIKELAQSEQQILLDAAVVRFLEHNICFRERLTNENLLIFPGLIKQKRPLQDDIPSTDDISYIVRSRVENIYATLVVLLGYTPSFLRINQWQNQAQYETDMGNICGFRLIEDREGEIELILYYGNDMPLDERQEFQALFERFLYRRDVQVTPFPPVICPQGHLQERATVVKRQRERKKFIYCDQCGAKIDLPDIEEAQTISTSVSPWLQREEAMARLRSTYEVHLSRVKSYRRDWATPRCYLSRLLEQAAWAEKLSTELQKFIPSLT
jgi:small GTP-binding protein